MDAIAAVRPNDPGPPAEEELALLACSQSGLHLLNALRFLGIDPTEIHSHEEALTRIWPTPWAYDVWCAWRACQIALASVELACPDIADDRRTTWRTSSAYALV